MFGLEKLTNEALKYRLEDQVINNNNKNAPSTPQSNQSKRPPLGPWLLIFLT